MTAWMEDAACRGADPELFFDEHRIDDAVDAYCRRCPVADECLVYAAERDSVGLWGGVFFYEESDDDE